MNTYLIHRRNAWNTPHDLEKAAVRSSQVSTEEMSDRIRWIRSYVVEEEDGRLGTICIYQATDPKAIREHACRANIPADEILSITQTVIVHEDPKDERVPL